MRPLKTLLIDNYDSYTYNLYQLIAEVNADAPVVICNDEKSWPAVQHMLRDGAFDNIVISPGPGTPACENDIGICLEVLKQAHTIPVLGVCLGFQALALVHGGTVRRAAEPVHGRLSDLEHSQHPLFKGLPTGSGHGLTVVRYHSLAVDEATLPPCLEPIAWTCGHHHALSIETAASTTAGACNGNGVQGEGKLLMAIAHRGCPHFGVQFHPESVGTTYGPALLQNFRDLTCAHRGLTIPPSVRNLAGPAGGVMPARDWASACSALLAVRWRVLRALASRPSSSVALFHGLFGQAACTDTFWLDSAATDRGRFSFMGGRGGPMWQRIIYRLPAPSAEQLRSDMLASAGEQAGTLTIEDVEGQTRVEHTTFLEFLDRQLRLQRCCITPEAAAGLPFNFWGGFVGYLGYELKAECRGDNAHSSPTPDAALFLADRLIAVDHKHGDVYAVSLVRNGDAQSEADANAWIDSTCVSIKVILAPAANASAGCSTFASTAAPQPSSGPACARCHHNGSSSSTQGKACSKSSCTPAQSGHHKARQLGASNAGSIPPPFRLRHPRDQYIQDVGTCLQALYDGECYEICLTTALVRKHAVDPFQLYLQLRQLNRAPYAAWLSFASEDLQVCCSSPERFLRGERGQLLEARPIKGTAPRSADAAEDAALATALAGSEKDRAENLMIVDLLRNDLGRVCAVGSVHVAELMRVESYATVHQLVSCVRGLRRQDASVVDCLRAAFPGGSMTGAPKIRAMQVLDALEAGPRGIYSGSIGYIAFNDTFDLNIVIRTAVVHDNQLAIGAGGAIVVQSDPAGEYDEMRLKAKALLQAVARCDAECYEHQAAAAVDENKAYAAQ